MNDESIVEPDVLLRRARNELLMQLPFYANLLFNMRIRKQTSSDDIPYPTAAVDRWGNLIYCDEFVATLNQGQLMFVLAHEASHVGLMHISRLNGRIPELWNIATDLEINYMLLQETRLIPPPYGLLPKDGRFKLPSGLEIIIADKTSEEIYDQLQHAVNSKNSMTMDQEWVEDYSPPTPKCNNKDSGQSGNGNDDSDSDKDSESKSKDNSQKKQKQSKKNSDKNDDQSNQSGDESNSGDKGKSGRQQVKPNRSKGFDAHVYGNELGGQATSGCDPSQYDSEEDFWKEKLISASQITKSRGIGMSDCLRKKLDLILAPPQIDWRHRIKIFITQGIPTDFTMKCPGRRGRALRLYMPTTIREHVKFVVGFDCSGSIGTDEMLSFISECYHMTKFFPSCELIIVPWNGGVMEKYIVEIKQEPTIEQLQKLTEFPGGGTVLQSFIDWCDQNCSNMDNIIIFTDGYVEDKKFRLQRNQSTLVVISSYGSDDILRQSFECVKLEETPNGRRKRF